MIVVLAALSPCRLMPFFIVTVTYFVTARPSCYLVVFCVCFCNPHPIYTHLLSCGVCVLPDLHRGYILLLFCCFFVFSVRFASLCAENISLVLGLVFVAIRTACSFISMLSFIASLRFSFWSSSHLSKWFLTRMRNIAIFHSEQRLAFLTCLETLTLRLFFIL